MKIVIQKIITAAIIAFGLLAMVLQMGIVPGEYYFDDGELSRLMDEREAAALAQGFDKTAGAAAYVLPAGLERYGPRDNGYFVRVRALPAGAQSASAASAC